MFALAVLRRNDVPLYESPVPAVVVATQVGTPADIARTVPFVPFDVTERAPVPPEVVTSPLVVKLESVEMFCDVLTLNALPEYVSPVPAVVVAPDETSPPNTASDPLASDGNWSEPEKVDDAVEKRPLNPITVVVEL